MACEHQALLTQSYERKNLVHPRLFAPTYRPAQRAQPSAPPLRRDDQILLCAQGRKNSRGLKFAANAATNYLIFRQLRHVGAFEHDSPGNRADSPDDGIHQRGLAGTVRSYHDLHGRRHHRQAHVIECLEAVEGDGDVFDLKERVAHITVSSLVSLLDSSSASSFTTITGGITIVLRASPSDFRVK